MSSSVDEISEGKCGIHSSRAGAVLKVTVWALGLGRAAGV